MSRYCAYGMCLVRLFVAFAVFLPVCISSGDDGQVHQDSAMPQQASPEEKPLKENTNGEKGQRKRAWPWVAKGHRVVVARVTAHMIHVLLRDLKEGGGWELAVSFHDTEANKRYAFSVLPFSGFGQCMRRADGQMCMLVFTPSDDGVLGESDFAAFFPLDWAKGQQQDQAKNNVVTP
ncbi:MAG: hypothetical protein NTU94_03580 [Planctomycetota bacterium]|nr:hypothetical protein [Planctomycetota bacterium]